ncbi:MAG: transpeptidase family protein [Prevotella sp.]|nr:transpeptidase family protein [Prevotella sp.]
MSKLDHKRTMFRYKCFFVLMTAVAISIVVRAGYIMTVEHDYWSRVADRVKRDSVPVMPVRGNILSCDGQLLASSLPEYRLFVDFNAMSNSKADTLWDDKEDSICAGLHAIFPSRTAEEFRKILREGKSEQSTRCAIWPRRVNYTVYSSVKELPIFSMASYKGGFYTEEYNARRRPYGSIAARTIGDMFGAKDTARCGLELSYDSLLRGEQGLMRRRKVLNRYISIVDEPAVNGMDIVTTIDVEMQDIAEQALIEELKDPKVNGEMGVAILMEVATGDVKAIVNMTKCEDGEYREVINSAINYRCEPGSVFKPASVMVALDDGVCDTSQIIHTGGGVMEMHSRKMKDHNWASTGGYGDINLARALEVSSNVGVSWTIDNYYSKNAQKYIDGLYRIGMAEDLGLPLVGYNPPIINYPKLNAKGQPEDKTYLPWMSIGYNTQLAPINTLTFYNAIANNGRMVKPRFVRAAVKDGVVLAEFPTEVIKEHIAKESTIKTIQTVLRHVVSQGLGKPAGSPLFQVSGKTGTAQVSQGSKGYKSGTTGYWLSFAGYFPSDAPRYSCIVCIKKWGLPASGGGMSGKVFRQIAEGVMARDLVCDAADLTAENSVERIPEVMCGNMLSANYILTCLDLKTNIDWKGNYASGTPVWGSAVVDNGSSVTLRHNRSERDNLVPNVVGMGAKDAVYLLESRGIRVQVNGKGSVRKQSIAPGTALKRGQTCVLTLSITS